MARAAGGAIGGIVSYGGGGEEQDLVENYFETKKMARLKQLTEVTPELMFPLTVAGVIQKKYKSKTLESMLRELYTLEVSKDRKGRDEYAEVALAVRRGGDVEGD